jgi:hypothetical protein
VADISLETAVRKTTSLILGGYLDLDVPRLTNWRRKQYERSNEKEKQT